MRAMVLHGITDLNTNEEPLVLEEIPKPVPDDKEVLIKISVCGVCHTELDEIEGRTPPPSFPVVLGHQVIGTVKSAGDLVSKVNLGDRVGVAWINSACGICEFCLAGNENLCRNFKATGRDADGGYAEYMTIDESFVYQIPNVFNDAEAAPLLCAGAIGYRSLKLTGMKDQDNLGLTGFGASGHLVLKMAKFLYPRAKIFVSARSEAERDFARSLGAAWAGDTTDNPPELLNAVIDTTPVWKPIVEALKRLKAGGRLVINAIRKENLDKDYLLKMDYPEHLWLEKEIKSVANITRLDVSEFLLLAAKIPIKPDYQEYKLADANTALLELKQKHIRGAKVLRVS